MSYGSKRLILDRYPIGVVSSRRRRRGGAAPIVFDSFDRANSATEIGTANSGHVWSDEHTWGIDSNQAYIAATAGGDISAWVDAGTANVDVRVTLSVIEGDASAAGIVFRLADVNNWWRFVFAGDTLFLQKETAGALSTPGSGVFTRANGTVLRVVANGNTISCYANSSLIVSTTDAFNNTATNHGLSGTNQSIKRWNNFYVYAP